MEEEIVYSNIQSKGCGTPCGWTCSGPDPDHTTYQVYGNCSSCTCSCGLYIDGEPCFNGYDTDCNGTCS